MSSIQGAGDPSERRDNQRFDLEVVVHVERNGTVAVWPSEDVSAGGMRLRVDDESQVPKVGERFALSFTLPLLADPVKAEGEVRWVDKGAPNICGIQFTTGLRAREVWAINRLHTRR
ncbi:PilZ domain-containing protein [Pseudenhygromyxa sp. WMMC2535]|uniref:PilZ domain-containing protein n=1 Tax=Pseudenhygromyxa sp. WMMC2535 TaxID=2712867 RepID=UPI0015542F8B|nr:PilZ domain-containing protein [Pseudenhygromyxa sp. WMMC2535]NVB39907.1 PilZ domain-containing protein [Pseudenhygromyxa sp. WMMC2535]